MLFILLSSTESKEEKNFALGQAFLASAAAEKMNIERQISECEDVSERRKLKARVSSVQKVLE